jgi:hypothetical protein
MADMDTINQALDEYERSLSLPLSYPPALEEEISKYFNMDRKEINSLTPADCAEIAYRLQSYAFFLSRTLNKEIARIRWAKAELNKCAANEGNHREIQKIYGDFDYKLNVLAKYNDPMTKLIRIKDYAELRKDRLDGLARHIDALARTLKDNQIAKVSEGKNYE